MKVDRPSATSNGWIHHASRRSVSPNRRRTTPTGTVDTAIVTSSRDRWNALNIPAGLPVFKRAPLPTRSSEREQLVIARVEALVLLEQKPRREESECHA